jgi:5'(3')-deoxyribonucleotidase
LRDWGYRSIYSAASGEMISEIFDSDEFFERVRVNPIFNEFYADFKDKVEFIIVTKGTYDNLTKKEQFFKEKFPLMHFIGCPHYFENMNYSKSHINMAGGIQIDDRVDALNTSASCKILLKNERDLQWNKYEGGLEGSVYIANTWKDIRIFVDFFVNNPCLLEETV